jgi:hypothetical protein
MELEPQSPKSDANSQAHSPRRWLKIGLISAVILLVCLACFLSLITAPRKPVIWLDAAKVTGTDQPGVVLKIKQKLSAWTAPMRERFRKKPPQLLIGAEIFSLPPEAISETDSVETNAAGIGVRILSPSELKAPNSAYRKGKGVTTMRISNLAGARAIITSGGAPAYGTNKATPTCTLDIKSKIAGGKISLTVGVIISEFVPVPGKTTQDIRTNIFTAFRCAVQSDGGILLLSTKTNTEGTSYKLLISPSAVDPAGNPIKL